MTENKEEKLNDVISKISGESEAEVDRNNIDSIRSLNITSFIEAQLQKAMAGNTLKDMTIQKIQSMMSDSDEDISFLALVRLLESLNKSENDFSLGITNSLTELYQTHKELDMKKENGGGEESGSFNVNDIDNVKKLLKLFQKLDESEML